MKRLRRPLIVLLLAAIAYVAIRVPQWKTEDDIRETVFRYQMRHLRTADIRAYYLSVGPCGWDTSPRRAFVRRFHRCAPPVKPFSMWLTENSRVQDRVTRNQGMILRAGLVVRLGLNRARVEGGFYQNGTSASGNTYTVVRKHGRWVVVHDKLHWIS